MPEIMRVPCHNSHAMHQAGRGDEGIALRARIRNVQLSAAADNRQIDGKHPLRKFREHIVLQPVPQNASLGGIPALDPHDADIQLHDGDGRQEKGLGLHLFCLSGDIGVCPARPHLPQFRNNIRVQQEHQPKSAGRRPRLMGAGSNSISSAPGRASASAIFRGLWVSRR